MHAAAVASVWSLFVTWASPSADSLEISLDLPTATVGGTLLLPREPRPTHCVVLVGGTLSQLRDGGLQRPGAPPRFALRRLAESLAAAGYGSFRYDQIGHGASRPKPGYTDLYRGDAEVLAGIYAYLRARPECQLLIAVGESAGAYIASLAARAGAVADAYVFLGGFCGKAEEIFTYNYARLVAYVEGGAEQAAWAKANGLNRELALGRRWREMFAAARAGKQTFDLVQDGYRETMKLARRREELDSPPDAMFAFIKKPSLALSGTRDLNVPPHHAACAAAVMQRAGNLRARFQVIAGADHNFQIAPDDADLAFRERYTFASFKRPYHPELDRSLIAWLQDVTPLATTAAGPASSSLNRAVLGPELEPKTDVSPRRLYLAPGVAIIDDILDRSATVGVETLEGTIGPLLRAPGMRAHYIDMPAGLYLEEHPHAKGSIIYTVRGRWGLKSQGRWHLMRPGSLFWFWDQVPTGYMVPFAEDAFVLIFKAVEGEEDAGFLRYLRRMAADLVEEQKRGAVFRLGDLPEDDPALRFAREVNPHFDRDFPTRRSQTKGVR